MKDMAESLLFDLPTPSLPIGTRGQRFPVGRIFCVGRNYAAHAREMGKDPERESPFFFMKPASALVDASTEEVSIPYPAMTNNFQYEVELVVAITKGGANIAEEQALHHVSGYAVGLDMTRRDLQLEARDKGRPWEFGKSFGYSAPIGALRSVQDVGHLRDASISLFVNQSKRQMSNISHLIWSVSECVSVLSHYDALKAGDLIMTGTPEGVGPVVRGDLMVGAIAGLGDVRVRIQT